MNTTNTEEAESRQLAKYRFYYKPEDLSLDRSCADPYFSKQVSVRLEELRRCYDGGTILDLCCGAGDYAFRFAGTAERIIGIDFSPEMIAAARDRARQEDVRNTSFTVANARKLPMDDGSMSLVYSFASLYHIPTVEEVVAEIGRVLQSGGQAVLEFGILRSLNTVVSREAPGSAEPHHVTARHMYAMLKENALTVERERCFQILPLWGSHPWWLRPLLHPAWKSVLGCRVGGRMLDEWLSSLPVVRNFAFRRLVICRKA